MAVEKAAAFEALPAALKQYPQWVVWRLVQKPGKPKPDKIPFSPATGQAASVSNPATWDSHDNALLAFSSGRWDGLGFVFTEQDPFAFIDLDHVRLEDGWNPVVQETLDKVRSWAEFSQSGDGIHVIAEAKGRSAKMSGRELYHYGRFVALTGLHVPNTPEDVQPCQAGVDWFRETILAAGGDESKPAAPPPSDPAADALTRLGLVLHVKQGGAKLELVCPWGHEHGNGDPQGAVYMPAHYNGRDRANFYCQHATCQAARRSNLAALEGYLATHDTEYAVQVRQALPFSAVEQDSGGLFVPAHTGLLSMLAEPKWLVKDFMERGQVGLLYGDSQALKSYLALDLATHLAVGRNWHGFEVQKASPVWFLAGEGNAILWRRLEALRADMGLHPDNLARLHISRTGLNLMAPDQLAVLQQTADALGGTPDLLIVDTLARNALLDENSARETGELIDHCTRLALAWDCTVLLVHHVGKANKSTARGSSALQSNTDFRYKLERNTEERKIYTTLTVEKMKGAPELLDPIIFHARHTPVLSLTDDEGLPLTDLTLTRVTETKPHVPPELQVKLQGRQAEVLSLTMEYLIERHAAGLFNGRPEATSGELWETWKRIHGKEAGTRSNFNRALRRLAELKFLAAEEDAQGITWYQMGRIDI